MFHYFLINNLIHDLETLDRLLLCDTHISLLQRDGAETTTGKNATRKGHVCLKPSWSCVIVVM